MPGLLSLLAGIAVALEPSAVLEDRAAADALITALIADAFPELADARVTIRELSSRSVNFTSQPHLGSWLSPFARTRYLIRINPRVYASDPSAPPLPLDAAEAILAHELAHTLDYVQGGSPAILRAALAQLGPGALARSERRTDLVAISRGYAAGLARYRTWIYPTLSARAEARKRKIYLS
ncbi:MAG TPA: hypothetical protein ENK18_16730, partial [Deltaproteobacteria bacterium]|nr:hypothetical protein [Deltaproteobacteria bacterium]